MADTKKEKNKEINFPRGTLEEMLRMMRVCREKRDIDCKILMKKIMGKEFTNADYEQFKEVTNANLFKRQE